MGAPGQRGTGALQRRLLAAMGGLRVASTAEIAERLFPPPPDRRVQLLHRRMVRMQLRTLGAVVIERNFSNGGFKWALPSSAD
jgi:hypothetical protein